MKILSVASTVAPLILLAACGGGGGGGPTPIPTPTPTPTPTNTTLTNLQFDQTFQSATSGVSINIPAPGTSPTLSLSTQPYGSGVSVGYTASTQTYRLTQGSATGTFAPANITSTTPIVTTYRVPDGAAQDVLALFKPGSGNTSLALTYTSYGGWLDTTTNGTAQTLDARFFVYGIPTAASDMPRTGSADYNTAVDGLWVEGTNLYSLSGTATFTAGFATNAVTTSMNLQGNDVSNGTPRALGAFTGVGSISSSSNTFAGTFTSPTAYSGIFNGAFFGPAAAEMGYSFQLTNGTNGAAVGAVVGAKQ